MTATTGALVYTLMLVLMIVASFSLSALMEKYNILQSMERNIDRNSQEWDEYISKYAYTAPAGDNVESQHRNQQSYHEEEEDPHIDLVASFEKDMIGGAQNRLIDKHRSWNQDQKASDDQDRNLDRSNRDLKISPSDCVDEDNISVEELLQYQGKMPE